ncbi:hypothetical protein FRC20_004282 [Serendipita sp. 405]|nr:hypothetical protein FRC20_004282 [Serendipita sp. 405]
MSSTTTTTTTMSRRHYSPSSKKVGSTKSTLRTLYEQAKLAFLQRNLALADKLVTQAFTLLAAPLSHGGVQSEEGEIGQKTADPLDSQRRKWDILRITLQTTIYTSQPSEATLSPLKFLHRLRSQSLKLFTPVGAVASITNVPDTVVLLLIVSALKLEEVNTAKDWVEEWLMSRNPQREDTIDPQINASDATNSPPMTSYERIIDIYVLHVLPRLDLWDDAVEFLRYESEMREEVKERISQSLQSQRKRQSNGSRNRTPSPTPSLASSTSTISVVSRQSPPRPASAASISSSASTATVRPPRTQNVQNGGSFSMTSIAKRGGGSGITDAIEAHQNGDIHGEYLSTQNGSEPSKPTNGIVPSQLSQSLAYNNHILPVTSSSSSSSDGSVDSPAGHNLRGFLMTPIFPTQLRHIFIHYYTLVADILNHQFGLALPTNFNVPSPHSRGSHLTRENIKLGLWHIFTLLLPLVLLFQYLSGRRYGRATPGVGGAGDKVRERLRRQHRSLALGPALGMNFWRAALRAVTDAVSMGGRGLI